MGQVDLESESYDEHVEHLRQKVREYMVSHPEKEGAQVFVWAAELIDQEPGPPVPLEAVVPSSEEMMAFHFTKKGVPPDAAMDLAESFHSRAVQALERSESPWWRRLWRKVFSR